MKKITLLVTLLFLSLQSQAQLFSQNFDTALTWTVSHPTGTDTNAGWTQVTSGTNPSCLPAAGAGMAKFASYDVAATNAYNLTSSAFTLSATSTYRVKFKMYRDAAYSTDADNIKGFSGVDLKTRINNACTPVCYVCSTSRLEIGANRNINLYK